MLQRHSPSNISRTASASIAAAMTTRGARGGIPGPIEDPDYTGTYRDIQWKNKTVPSASTFGNPKCRGKKCWRFKLDNATTSGSAITKSRIPVRAKKTAQLEPNPPAPAMPMRADANTLHCSAARCPSNTASQPITPSAIPHLIHNIPHNGTPAERPPRQSKVLGG